MKAPLRSICFGLLLILCVRSGFGDDVTFLSLDQLADYTADPTYDPTQDPLHGFCYGSSPACYSNGIVTPTPTDPPQFGFTVAPGPQTGRFLVDLLIPNNDAFNANFQITGIQGGINNNAAISGTPTLFSSTAWTSGTLASYLGISASPSNPISAWLPYTQANGDAGATGYYVYVSDLQTNTLQPNAGWAAGPLLDIGPLPTGSLIVGFLDPPGKDIATANSSAIFVAGSSSSVPEPGALLVLGTALAAIGISKRFKQQA